jgi:hypothetical protein
MLNSQRLPASRFRVALFACTLVLSAGLICAGSIESLAQGPCEVMDPTGTPLNVRARPAFSKFESYQAALSSL